MWVFQEGRRPLAPNEVNDVEELGAGGKDVKTFGRGLGDAKQVYWVGSAGDGSWQVQFVRVTGFDLTTSVTQGLLITFRQPPDNYPKKFIDWKIHYFGRPGTP